MAKAEQTMSFTVEIGTNNRYTIPPAVIKGLGLKRGDILQLKAEGITRKSRRA